MEMYVKFKTNRSLAILAPQDTCSTAVAARWLAGTHLPQILAIRLYEGPPPNVSVNNGTLHGDWGLAQTALFQIGQERVHTSKLLPRNCSQQHQKCYPRRHLRD